MSSVIRDAGGEILVGNHRISSLTGVFGSPLYVYDLEQLRNTYLRVRAQLHAGVHIRYAVKANPNPTVVRQYVALGAGLDVSSMGEMALALSVGASPGTIGFAGPGKTDDELREAISSGVTLSVESLSELKSLERLANQRDQIVQFTLRVAFPDQEPLYALCWFELRIASRDWAFGHRKRELPGWSQPANRMFDRSGSGFHLR